MKGFVSDGLVVSGIGLISYGAWLIDPPFGFIAGGVLVGLLGVFLVPLGAKRKG